MTETKRQLCRTCVGPDECDLWHVCHPPHPPTQKATRGRKPRKQQPKRKYPVIKCLPRPDFPLGMMFWCPFCQRFHLHGIDKGHRVSHCTNSESPLYKHGYVIKMLPKATLREIVKGIERYLELSKK
jgi:hypothetical protein